MQLREERSHLRRASDHTVSSARVVSRPQRCTGSTLLRRHAVGRTPIRRTRSIPAIRQRSCRPARYRNRAGDGLWRSPGVTHSKSRRHRLRQRQRPSTHHICLPHPVHVRAFPVPVDRLGEHHPRAPSYAPSGPIRQHHSQRLTTSRPAASASATRQRGPYIRVTCLNALTRVYTATGRRLTSGRGGDRTPDRWCVKLPQSIRMVSLGCLDVDMSRL